LQEGGKGKVLQEGQEGQEEGEGGGGEDYFAFQNARSIGKGARNGPGKVNIV